MGSDGHRTAVCCLRPSGEISADSSNALLNPLEYCHHRGDFKRIELHIIITAVIPPIPGDNPLFTSAKLSAAYCVITEVNLNSLCNLLFSILTEQSATGTARAE
ncbi:hypothetical protein J6590_032482 [Homalodisca vitripennis]|nr:hypothetical protein J6590_032482 [Homalodisca vitripennis]